jgi:hypothetical protein
MIPLPLALNVGTIVREKGVFDASDSDAAAKARSATKATIGRDEVLHINSMIAAVNAERRTSYQQVGVTITQHDVCSVRGLAAGPWLARL